MLFVLIQHDTDGPMLDKIMPILREPLTWVPLYAFMLFILFVRVRPKAWPFIILTLLTFAITDTVAAQLLKPLFGRLRALVMTPICQGMIRGLVDCGGLYSMPSNHAANHFGLAAFWYFSIREMNGRKWSWLWVWAACDLLCADLCRQTLSFRYSRRSRIRLSNGAGYVPAFCLLGGAPAPYICCVITDPHKAEWETWLQKWFVPLLIPAILVNAGGLLIPILEPDGALYATIAKTIARSGNFVDLYVDGRDWLDKPHFPFWMAALSMRVFGINGFAYKFPALLFWGCRGLVYLAARAVAIRETGGPTCDPYLCIRRASCHLQQRCPGRALSDRADYRGGLSFL